MLDLIPPQGHAGMGALENVSGNVFFPHNQFSASHAPSVLHHLASQQLGNKRIREKLPLQYICSGCLLRAQEDLLPLTENLISTLMCFFYTIYKQPLIKIMIKFKLKMLKLHCFDKWMNK